MLIQSENVSEFSENVLQLEPAGGMEWVVVKGSSDGSGVGDDVVDLLILSENVSVSSENVGRLEPAVGMEWVDLPI